MSSPLAWLFLLTGMWVWAMMGVAAVVLFLGIVFERLQQRRTRKVLAAWAKMEDERRERRKQRAWAEVQRWAEHYDAADRLIAEAQQTVGSE